MGQAQGKDDTNPRTKSKTVKDKHKHGLGPRTFSSTSQVNTESENGGFTLPWDLRGPQDQDQDFMKNRPLPTIPPENGDNLLEHADLDIDESEMYFVQYDFDAGANENQLSVKKSELIRIISFDDQKVWCEGQNRNGKIGWLPYTYLVPFDSLHKFDWFHGQISRNRAEYLLNSGINGSFLMRESESAPGQHSLSLRYDGRVYHYRVYFDDNENVYVREEAKFKTLEELVKYHSDEAGGLVTNLRYAALKVDKPPVYGFEPSEDEWEIARMDIFMGQKLGGGQYGDVYKAEYKKYGATVAVKTLKEDTDVEEFLKEADVMKLIKHPNLVKLIGVCTRERPIYIITEYMPLGNLLEYLRQAEKSDLPATTLIYIASQVSAAMKYLEEQNFIHRDLAARNCLVGDNHLIKVADFGLARSMQQDYYKAHSGAKFPIKWTSPEALAYNKFSTKSDVWAFGILMWEIATYGKSPYPGSDLNQVYGLLEQGYRMECPEGCPSAVYELMRDCWSWNPAERPTFCDICHRLDYMFETKNVDEEVRHALRTRPLSMHVSDVEGMVLPPKPPKRRTNNDVADGKKKTPLPAIPSNAPPKPTIPPPRKPMPQIPSEENLKKDKTNDKKISLMSRKFKGKDKKSTENKTGILEQDESSMSDESAGMDNMLHSHAFHGSQSLDHSNIQSSLTGSRISLNEIQGGLSKVLTKRKHRSDVPSASLENIFHDNDEFHQKTNEHFENGRRPMLPPGNKPHPLRPKNDIEVRSEATAAHMLNKPSKPPLPLRPVTPSKNADPVPLKPQLPVKPTLKPRPSFKSPNPPDKSPKTQRQSASNVELRINMDNLKRELIPISESMQTVYKVITNLITLAELRQSENIRFKTEAASKECSILVDELSQYRDSIGPVTRMKVNKHLTVIESQVNDFITVSKNMPRIATATDLEKMSKCLSILCDSLKALSVALPNL